MRPTPSIVAVVIVASDAQYGGERQLSPPPALLLSSAAPPCASHDCMRPSSKGDMEANAALVVIIMTCALVCALALNIAIRCSIRYQQHSGPHRTQQNEKPIVLVEVGITSSPRVVYEAGMVVVECAICLSEFVEGEGIRLLNNCKHGFHEHCIHQWLSSHSTCPTCRNPCD